MPDFNEALSKQVIALREAEALPVSKPTTKVGDAVMWPRTEGRYELLRVEAVTEDGRACVLFKDDYRIEEEPGEWPVVGEFFWRGWLRGWKFQHVSQD